MRRWPPLAAGLLALAGLAACPVEQKAPGEVIGTFDFEVWLVEDSCGFAAEGDGGRVGDLEPFVATLSHDRSAGRFYLTRGATLLEGTLEGDRFELDGHAARTLPCGCDGGYCSCAGTIDEHLEGTVYGQGQVAAGGCEADPHDVGEPTLRDGGWDVRLVCGFVSDRMSAQGQGCSCPSCLVVYRIAGERQ